MGEECNSRGGPVTAMHENGPLRDPEACCGGTFRCTTCKRTVGWCKGCSDDYPGLCDECANKRYEDFERRAHESWALKQESGDDRPKRHRPACAGGGQGKQGSVGGYGRWARG